MYFIVHAAFVRIKLMMMMMIVHNLTRGMSYTSMLFYSKLNSLDSPIEDLSRSLFRVVLKTYFYLHSLLRSPRPPVSPQGSDLP